MDGTGARGAYSRPTVQDYGDLVELTGDLTMLHVGVGSPTLMAVSSATSPGGSVVGATQASPAAGGQLGTSATGTGTVPGSSGGGVAGTTVGGGGSGLGGSGGGGSGGGGGGDLPFTGLAVGAMAAVGGGLSAAGVAVRRWLRRESA
jgi:hypothetical protein